MRDTRRNRILAFAGVFALALTAGVMADRALNRRPSRISVDEDLRDAVAAPPATAGLAGKPVPTSWFKSPEQRESEIDTALLSSRRRRLLARRAALQ